MCTSLECVFKGRLLFLFITGCISARTTQKDCNRLQMPNIKVYLSSTLKALFFFFKLAYVAENLINPETSAFLYETAFEHLFSSFSSFYLFVFCSSSDSSSLPFSPEMSWKGVLLLYLL